MKKYLYFRLINLGMLYTPWFVIKQQGTYQIDNWIDWDRCGNTRREDLLLSERDPWRGINRNGPVSHCPAINHASRTFIYILIFEWLFKNHPHCIFNCIFDVRNEVNFLSIKFPI